MTKFDPSDLERTVTLTEREFEDLFEYSCSLPSLTTIGKRWKCDKNFGTPGPIRHLHFFDGAAVRDDRAEDWWMGEYVEINDPDRVDIHWRKIFVRSSQKEALVDEVMSR